MLFISTVNVLLVMKVELVELDLFLVQFGSYCFIFYFVLCIWRKHYVYNFYCIIFIGRTLTFLHQVG